MWEYTFKVIDETKLGWRLKNGDTLTFTAGASEYNITWLDKDGKSKRNSYSSLWGNASNPASYKVKDGFQLVSKKIHIETSCEPYMYNTKQDLIPYQIGDDLEVTFGKKSFRIKKEYVGQTIKFRVMNTLDHEWGHKMKRLALVPVDKLKKFKQRDILFLDNTWRFEALMIDLFPVNRRPYAGWKNKTVKVKTAETFDELLEL